MHGGDIYRNKVEHDFSVNINPCGIPTSVKTAMINSINEMDTYPDLECEELRSALSESFEVTADCIICGNGASELNMAICQGLRPNKVMLIAPGFMGYEKAVKAVDAKEVYFYLEKENNFTLLADKLCKAIEDEKPELLFLTNPNNPNGGIISYKEMEKIIDCCQRNNTVLVVDECFEKLSTADENISVVGLTNKYSNLLVVRAFTKSFAIPGVRLGFLICQNKGILTNVNKQLPEWNVSVPAMKAGMAALKEDSFLIKSKELIKEEREYLAQRLLELGIKVYPSEANFVLFEGPLGLYEKLLSQGILIRDCCDYKGLGEGFYRVAVKNRQENEVLINAIKGDKKETVNNAVEYVLPGDIEKRSFEIIGEELKLRGIDIPLEQLDVTKRVIHTSADFEYAHTMCYSPDAVAIARELILNGADIVTDTNMAKAGINKNTLAKFGGEVHCFMADEDVAKEAKERAVTRATVSMEYAARIDKPVIFAIGNAPTALLSLKELMDKTGFKPAFVIGVPVGFVNVEIAKEIIMETGVPYIVNRGRKGGSNVAAAICNALMYGLVKRD